MVKTIFILKPVDETREAFCAHVKTQVIPRLLDEGARTLKVTLTEDPRPALAIIPFSKTPVACVSAKGDRALDGVLDGETRLAGAYQADEALPVSYEMDWEVGHPTPGVCLLTLFNKKAGLAPEVFLDRWHNGHTPLSLRIHPLWNYVRNVVTRTRHGQPWDGIVEEQVRTRSELLNPFVFFGGWRFLPNMIATWRDIRGFMDLGTMETYLAREVWFRR